MPYRNISLVQSDMAGIKLNP